MERLENSRWGFESNCFVCEEKNPVQVGGRYRVRAEVAGDDGDVLQCRAEVTDEESVRCATAAATFVPLGPAQAVGAIGTTVTGDDAEFLRGPGAAND